MQEAKHRCHFTKRPLLIWTVVAMAGIAWVSFRGLRVHNQSEAVRELRELGAKVMYDFDHSTDTFYVSYVSCPADRLSAAMNHLRLVQELDLLEITGNATQTAFEEIRILKKLKSLRFLNSNVSDETLDNLTHSLPSCHCTRDDGLQSGRESKSTYQQGNADS